MTKIVIESSEKGNNMEVLEPKDGVRAIDVMTTIGSPLMSLALDICSGDRDNAIKMLTCLLDGYIKTNGDTDFEWSENND